MQNASSSTDKKWYCEICKKSKPNISSLNEIFNANRSNTKWGKYPLAKAKLNLETAYYEIVKWKNMFLIPSEAARRKFLERTQETDR